jgi:hypothetical protein
MGLVVAAMVHGYNRWAWAHASFDLPDGRYTGAIDALAVKYGDGASAARTALMTTGGYHRLDRVSVTFPPYSNASASATRRRAAAWSPWRWTRRPAQ